MAEEGRETDGTGWLEPRWAEQLSSPSPLSSSAFGEFGAFSHYHFCLRWAFTNCVVRLSGTFVYYGVVYRLIWWVSIMTYVIEGLSLMKTDFVLF